jgi:ankyrin repeat protein
MSHSRIGFALSLVLTLVFELSCSSKPAKSREEIAAQQAGFFGAIRKGDAKSVKAFIDNGADVNAKDDYSGDTASILASNNPGYTEIVRMLIDAKADVNARGNGGQTALLWASWDPIWTGNTRTAMVRMLIDAKADVNANDDAGFTALIRASESNTNSVLTITDTNGKAAVRKIASHREIIRMLIDAKADVNAESKDGRTALVVALYKRDAEIVRMLKEAGADDVRAKQLMMRQAEIVRMLKYAGAK